MGDLLDGSMKPVKLALEDAKLSPNDIQEVVLVGGFDAYSQGAETGS